MAGGTRKATARETPMGSNDQTGNHSDNSLSSTTSHQQDTKAADLQVVKDLEEELETLERRKKIKQLRAKIEAEKRALEDPTAPPHKSRAHTLDSDSDVETKGSRKRQKKDEARLTITQPKAYSGESHEKYKQFIRACELTFETRPVTYGLDADKIRFGKAYLEGKPQDSWYRKQEADKRSYTWDEFKTFLLDDFRPASLRKHDVFRKYNDAKQKPNQSVSEFVTYMDSLEEQLEPYTESQRIAHLMTRLHPYIGWEVQARREEPKTRQELIDIANLIEEQRVRQSATAYRGKPQGQADKEGTGSQATGNQATGSNRAGAPTQRFKKYCSFCKFTGHTLEECYKKNRRPREDPKAGAPST